LESDMRFSVGQDMILVVLLNVGRFQSGDWRTLV
jgi:hypothetical protein